MPRSATAQPIDDIIRKAADDVVAHVSSVIARQVAHLVEERISEELAGRRAGARGPRGAGARRPRAEITRWVADARARRVPNFVIEATGLDTKKKIVAKFGDGAAFERGKPLPRAKS